MIGTAMIKKKQIKKKRPDCSELENAEITKPRIKIAKSANAIIAAICFTFLFI